MKRKEYVIPFSGLKQGKHHFEYQIDKTFFDSFDYDDFSAADVHVDVILEKMSNMMELRMEASGSVNVACDVTSEPFDQPIEAILDLVIKFGEEFNDEDDEILVLPFGEHQFNIAQYMYEMLVLAVPPKRIHPGVTDGSLDSAALRRLEELSPKEQNKSTDDTDPRWDALRDLLTDKN